MLGARNPNLSLDSDVPLSVSFSSVGNGCSPRFKAEGGALTGGLYCCCCGGNEPGGGGPCARGENPPPWPHC